MTFKGKCTALFRGKKSFSKRITESLPACLALTFTLFCFGPLDLAEVGKNYLTYSALDLLEPVLLLWTAASFCLCAAVAVPGGHMHAFLLSAVSGCGIACWLQGAFLNPDLGTLDGRTIAWESYTGQSLLNLLIWGFIILLPFLLHFISRKVWRNFVILSGIVLLLMQGTSLGIKLAERKRAMPGGEVLTQDTSESLCLPSGRNVLVFLLDSVSNQDLDETLAEFPKLSESFHDFTWFDNCGSRYLSTFPSVLEMLTGFNYDAGREKYADAFAAAWDSEQADTYYRALQNGGYQTELYMETAEIASDLFQLEGKFTNIKPLSVAKTLNKRAFANLVKLSFYRYSPLIMKASFWIYTEDITDVFRTANSETDPWALIERFNRDGLRKSGDENTFRLYYFYGSHKPWRMNADGRSVRESSVKSVNSRTEQLSGHLNFLAEFLKQMRDFGVYDDALIFIIADHGNNLESDRDRQPIFLVKRPGEKNDAVARNHAPIILQEQFFPTVLQSLGMNSDGISAFDVDENTKTERCSSCFGYSKNYPDIGRFNVLREYCYTGDGDALIEKMMRKEHREIPLKDSFY